MSQPTHKQYPKLHSHKIEKFAIENRIYRHTFIFVDYKKREKKVVTRKINFSSLSDHYQRFLIEKRRHFRGKP